MDKIFKTLTFVTGPGNSRLECTVDFRFPCGGDSGHGAFIDLNVLFPGNTDLSVYDAYGVEGDIVAQELDIIPFIHFKLGGDEECTNFVKFLKNLLAALEGRYNDFQIEAGEEISLYQKRNGTIEEQQY